MDLYINDINANGVFDIQKATVTDNITGAVDTLEIFLNPTTEGFYRKCPNAGDSLKLKELSFDSGAMCIDSISQSENAYEIIAKSAPDRARIPKSKTWVEIELYDLIYEIAEQNGLKVKLYDVTNRIYPKLKQDMQSDLSLLAQRCLLEGLTLKVFDNTLIIASIESLKNSEPSKTVNVSAGYKFDAQKGLGGIKMHCNDLVAQYIQDSTGTILNRSDTPFFSIGEGERYSENLFKALEKKKLKYNDDLDITISAGSVFIAEGEGDINGKYFAKKVTHDFVGRKTQVEAIGID